MRVPAWTVALVAVSAGCRGWAGLDAGVPDDQAIAEEPNVRLGGTLTIPGDVVAPSGDVTVGMVRADLSGGGLPVLDGVYQSDDVGAVQPGDAVHFEFDMQRRPPSSEMYTPDPAAPPFQIASYMLGAWVDQDGDGEVGPGEPLVGSTLDLLIYASGERTDKENEPAGAIDLPQGWNVVPLDIGQGKQPVIVISSTGDYLHLELDGNLLPAASQSLAGTVEGGDAGVSVDVVSLKQAYGGAPPADPTFATTSAGGDGSFSFADLGQPGSDAYMTAFGGHEIYGGEGAPAQLVAYRDANGDGAYTPGVDTRVGTSLGGSSPTFLVDLRPTDFTAVVYDGDLGQAAGWLVFDGATGQPTGGGGPVVVAP